MKAKVKLDTAKLKAAVVKHFEKVLFAVVGLCFVWLVYSAMSVERFTGTPEALQQVSTETESHLKSRRWEDAKDQANLVSKVEFGDALKIDPDGAAAAWKDFDPADKPTKRRAAPKVLTASGLQARGGIGAIVVVADQVTLASRALTAEEEANEAAQKAAAEAERATRTANEGRGTGGAYGGYPGPGARGAGGYSGPQPPGEGGGRGAGGGRGPRNRGNSPYGPGTSPYGPGAPGMTNAPATEEVVEVPMVVPTADQIIKGVRWVCLTGVVPGKKQFEEFEKAAGKDFPMLEAPRYVMFEVQRTEFAPGKKPAETDWQDVNVLKALMDARKEWATQYPVELADPEKVNPFLAMPLPPLVTRNWGDEVVHAPEIERLDPQAMQDTIMMRYKELEEAKKSAAKEGQTANGEGSGSEQQPLPPGPTDAPEDSWDSVLGGTAGGYGGSPYGRSGGEGVGRMPGGYGGSPYGGSSPYGGRSSGSPYGGSPYGGSAYGAGPGMTGSMTPPEHFLLRFFDFTVDSGKSYVYRVRLRMANPNWQLPANQLENPSLKNDQYIYGDWSEITDAARVPGDDALLAGEALTSGGPFEPSAKVILEHFDQEKGVMTSVADKVVRGQMANSKKQDIKYIDPIKLKVETFEDVEVDTGMTVVDILGGGRIGKNAAKLAPSRLLTMDSDGNFEIREELTDRTAFASADAAQKRVKEAEELGTVPGGSYGASGMSPYGGGSGARMPYGPQGGRPYGPGAGNVEER